MQNLPIEVSKTLLGLREKYEHYVEIKVIKGSFCVFESTSSYDKEAKKTKKKTHYLGRIKENGEFIQAKHRQKTNEHSEAINLPYNVDIEEMDQKILTALSMNGRITNPLLSKTTGLPITVVHNRVKKLEKIFGIKYMSEIDVEKLGFLQFLILVKFLNKIPDTSEIEAVAKQESNVQLVALLNGGEYDLVFYVLAETNGDVNRLNLKLMSDTVFVNYPSEWYITPFYETYGFVPLREEFIESLKYRINTSNKKNLLAEETTPKVQKILKREIAVLKELNNDGGIAFSEIDKKYGFDNGRAQYSYHKLIENGLLKRVTISMTKISIKYINIAFMKIIDYKKFGGNRAELLEDIIKATPHPTNKYILTGDIGVPFTGLLFSPIFVDDDSENIKNKISKINGTILKNSIITKLVIGNFVFRKFDNTYALQYTVLHERYSKKPLGKVNYSHA